MGAEALLPYKKRPAFGADLFGSGRRGSHRPRRQIGVSPYLADGDVGYRATRAPISNRARFGACDSLGRADLGPRHTGDRGASCATPSREVVPRPSGTSRLTQTPASPGPDGPRCTRFAVALLVGTQRFRTGAAKVRGDVSPRAAGGGPIHARLTLGNSAVPARRMLRSDASRFFRRIARSDAHCSSAGGVVPRPKLSGRCRHSSRSGRHLS
jgi:hypothetical protein